MSLKTFKPLENYRLNNGNLEIQLDPLTNKLLIENKLKGTKYFINTITGEHNLTMDYKIIYDRVDNLKDYVIAADKTLQDQINDILDEIGTIDGTLPEHNKKIEKLQEELLKAFDELEGIHSTNENLQNQIDVDKQHLNEYITSTNSTISEINQQIISDKASLETRIGNTEQNIINAEQRLTEDINASEQRISNIQDELTTYESTTNNTINGIQTTNSNLQKQISENAKTFSDYKSTTDSTISGIQTTNENLQQQISENAEAFSNYKSSTNNTISGIQSTNENLQQQITDNAKTFSDYKSSTDSTISGIQTTNENLQKTITDNQTSFVEYKTSTDSSLSGIQTTNSNLQKQIDDDKKQLSNYISSTNSTISGIQTTNENLQKQITNNKSSLEKSIAENKNNISAVNSSLSSYKSSTNNTISGIQSTNSNLQKQIDADKQHLSEYITSTDSTISGIQTKNENLQQQIDVDKQHLNEYITLTDSTIAGIQTTNTNLQQQITDNASAFSDYTTTTDSTIVGIQTTNTNLQEQITNNASAFSEYKTTTDNTINGIQTTNSNLQQQITDTNTILTEYKTTTNSTISGINTEITNLKTITGTDGTEITNLKKITASLSDDVASIETNIGTHASKIETLENGIKQKADISALTTMEARINDNIDVKIDNVVSVTNTIETNIENIDGEIVNINNEITNQITINNNINSTISNVQSNVASIQNEMGTKPSSGTIWGNINTLNSKTACIDCTGTTASAIRVTSLKNVNNIIGSSYLGLAGNDIQMYTTWGDNWPYAMARCKGISISDCYNHNEQTIKSNGDGNILVSTDSEHTYFNNISLADLIGETLYNTTQSEIGELKMYIEPPTYESCTVELCENSKAGGAWYTASFSKKRMKFYRTNNCIWLSNNESEMYYFTPKSDNGVNYAQYKVNQIKYNGHKTFNYEGDSFENVPMTFPWPSRAGYQILCHNKLVPRGYTDEIIVTQPRFEHESRNISLPIPPHQHYLTSPGDKGGLCTPDNKENAANNSNSFKYAFIGSRSSQTYKNIFEPCDNVPSGPVIGTTYSYITIPANPAASFTTYNLICVYKIPLVDKNKSMQEIIRPLYSYFDNWATADKLIQYINDNPWGDRTADDIFV